MAHEDCKGARDETMSMMQTEEEVRPVAEDLAQALFDHIPVGVGSQGIIPTSMSDLEAALEMGIDFSIREARPYSPR